MKYRAPETVDTGGGNWLDKPGTYHLVVTATDEEPLNNKQQMMDAFRVTFQAIDGTVRDANGFTERHKTVDLIFWNPKLTDKNEGLFARQKQARFFLATGLLTEEQLGAEVDIDLEDAVGRQVIATLEETDSKDGGRTFLNLHFADIWHIDDPAAAKYPKNDKAIALVPPSHRRDPSSFEKKANGSTAKSKPATKTETVDIDDL